MKDKRIHVERRYEGDYVVRLAHSERVRDVLPTQREAIAFELCEFSPESCLHVERPRENLTQPHPTKQGVKLNFIILAHLAVRCSLLMRTGMKQCR